MVVLRDNVEPFPSSLGVLVEKSSKRADVVCKEGKVQRGGYSCSRADKVAREITCSGVKWALGGLFPPPATTFSEKQEGGGGEGEKSQIPG